MITLYDMSLSGNCHKVRLLLSLLGLPYQTQAVDLRCGEQRSPDYLQRNPFAQVPVLDDDGLIIRDSQAILVHLAKRYGCEKWWPDDAYQLAQIAAWLSTAANEIFHGPAKLRVHHKFGSPIDTVAAGQTTDKVLGIIDRHLQNQDWLVGDSVSIADIAVYPYLALAPEGSLDIGAFPNIIAWFQRIRALPGYVAMPGMWQA
ncbi:glutathione S-transferase family protein [Methylomonas koyamae]|uniref:Glutathione S-transferase n=1 Tax=Methylomonas koyamae TaxID=702114 RepID=A0A177NHU9_9GAMM|nr:glutathione S-transferase [Methylomonas koyamae]OAI17547.1 glutathione S-transferase [Methylomonas koyamae]